MFDSERHEACTTRAWDASLAMDQVHHCFKDVIEFLRTDQWREQGEEVAATTMYEGAIGVLWAGVYLSRELDQPLPFSVAALCDEIFAAYAQFEAQEFKEMDVPNVTASYFLGHSGTFNIMQSLVPGRYLELQQKLVEIATGNIDNATLEILWGGPGSILPVLNNLEAGHSETSGQLQALFQRQFEFLRSKLERAADYDCYIWTQDLYGSKRRITGAGHGFVGNVYPFLRGQRWLPESDRKWLLETVVDTILKTAVVDGELANWPPSLGETSEGAPDFLVQWCHGAPGMILGLNHVQKTFSSDFDEVLLKAGETTWHAGPLTKGLGLCHGTDGNGYALLKLFQRTGDQIWLDRARAFAMHGIGQYQNRQGFWVGDSALALFLLACRRGASDMPLWDFV